MEAKRILSTKKLLPNQKQFLLNAGISVIEADFITVHYTPFKLTDIRQNLIFTSRNAVISFLRNEESSRYLNHPVFCVGSKTKEAAENAGYTVAAVADYGEELAGMIVNGYAAESFTFFSGSLRREVLPDALTDAGIAFNEIEVYQTILSPHKIDAVLDGILFYSPSGIESYLRENSISDEVCFCIGNTTAEALKDITGNIVVATKPSVENVIVQCINYYKNI